MPEKKQFLFNHFFIRILNLVPFRFSWCFFREISIAACFLIFAKIQELSGTGHGI